MTNPARVVVVGATASGKSALALALAGVVDGGAEIVTADSMQVYRGMDVGTAKPSAVEQAQVAHHLLDVADPEDDFSVAAYLARARPAIDGIIARGATALVVGGTGLYVQAVVDVLDIPGRWPEVRARLEAGAGTGGTEALHLRLSELDPVAAARIDPGNRRRLLRALEVCLGSGRPFSSFGPGLGAYGACDFAQIGLRVPLDQLDARIERRFRGMLGAGLLDEVRALDAGPRGLSRTASQALGYRELLAHLRGESSLDEAVATAIGRTRRFARRQLRWFRRDPRIRWIDADDHRGPDILLADAAAALGDWPPCT